MFRHKVIKESENDGATLILWGNPVFTQAQEMESALSEALEGCRQLTIDVSGLESFDSTFQVLLCSLHRRSELENKTITMKGALPRRESDQDMRLETNGCLLNDRQKACPVWEPLLGCERRTVPPCGQRGAPDPPV